MQKPRFRLFGGPNGSGKTHVFNKFKAEGYIHTEIYVSADKIESELKENRRFSFNAYRVKVDIGGFKEHIINSGLYQTKLKDKTIIEQFSIRSGILRIGTRVNINSYHASFIASYLAERLFESGQSFAFETVMSHNSKVEMLKKANAIGYKTYLYFVFTDSIETNIARVRLRVLQGEHDVNEETIKSRAPRTFNLLPAAFKLAKNAYVIDNSDSTVPVLIKEDDFLTKSLFFPPIIKKPLQKIVREFDGEINEFFLGY